MTLGNRSEAELRETLARMQRHKEAVEAERRQQRVYLKRLGAYGRAFADLYQALLPFEGTCAHETREGCNVCRARLAIASARTAMSDEGGLSNGDDNE